MVDLSNGFLVVNEITRIQREDRTPRALSRAFVAT